MKGEKKMEGEKSKMQLTYTGWVQMCDVVMCEDIAGYYKRGPPYFITLQQSSLAFLQHSSEAQPDQPHSFLPTRGAFIVQFAFSSFMSSLA